MESLKKLEIVINALEKDHLIKVLQKNGITSYTLIEDVKGRGDRGWQDGAGLTDSFKNVYIMVACSQDDFDQVKEPLRAFIKKVGGICLLSDTDWLKH